MNIKQGLICKLTNEKASFKDECPDYKFDKKAQEIIISTPNEPTHKNKETTLRQALIIPIILIFSIIGIIINHYASRIYTIGYINRAVSEEVAYYYNNEGKKCLYQRNIGKYSKHSKILITDNMRKHKNYRILISYPSLPLLYFIVRKKDYGEVPIHIKNSDCPKEGWTKLPSWIN